MQGHRLLRPCKRPDSDCDPCVPSPFEQSALPAFFGPSAASQPARRGNDTAKEALRLPSLLPLKSGLPTADLERRIGEFARVAPGGDRPGGARCTSRKINDVSVLARRLLRPWERRVRRRKFDAAAVHYRHEAIDKRPAAERRSGAT